MIDIKELIAKENRSKLAMSLFRVSMGVMFVSPAWGKVTAEGGFGQRMVGFLNSRKTMPDWYRDIVDAVVIPNANLFGYMVAYGELFLAISLIIGVKTRTACILGVFLVANFIFAKGGTFWSASNHDSLYILAFLLLFFSDAGRFMGGENWVEKKFPKLPL